MQWFEDEVKNLESKRHQLLHEPKTIFYGSSSITLWDSLEEDLKEFRPLNLGFGGSTLAACTWYFDRIVAPYNPQGIIIYAGDNDLGDGRNPEEVLIFFQMMIVKIRERFGNVPCGYISIKPSISRWNIIDRIKYTNTLIEEEIKRKNEKVYFLNIFPAMLDDKGLPNKVYFQQDGLHLSKEGYQLWQEVIRTYSAFFV